MKMRKFLALLLTYILALTFAVPAQAATPKLSKTKMTIYVGKSKKLKLKNATKKVTWKSSNKKIAKVSSKGNVKGIAAGKATITAKHNGKNYKCTVTVKEESTMDTLLIQDTLSVSYPKTAWDTYVDMNVAYIAGEDIPYYRIELHEDGTSVEDVTDAWDEEYLERFLANPSVIENYEIDDTKVVFSAISEDEITYDYTVEVLEIDGRVVTFCEMHSTGYANEKLTQSILDSLKIK